MLKKYWKTIDEFDFLFLIVFIKKKNTHLFTDGAYVCLYVCIFKKEYFLVLRAIDGPKLEFPFAVEVVVEISNENII